MRQQHIRAGRRLLAAMAMASLSVSVSGQSPPPVTPATETPGARSAVPLPATDVRRLSVDDAVRLSLEQNLSIQVERLNPQIQDLSTAQVRAAWTPVVSSTILQNSLNAPSNSVLSGVAETLTRDTVSTQVNASQLLPWGGSYNVGWDSSRLVTNNSFQGFNPDLTSNFGATYSQPLLRNFRIDNVRQQLIISKKNREMSDIQLRQTIVGTVRDVKNAYWDLSYAVTSLAVQRQSLDLARESLRNNRSRVEIGTMAPIDIVEAEAEVAQREESVILAEAAISQAEDRLRSLIFDPSTKDFWNIKLELTDAAPFQMQTIDVDRAMRNALDKRTDIREARKTLETSDVNISYFRNQTLPDVNVQANYGLTAEGGTQFIRGPGFPGPIIGEQRRSFGSVLGDLLHNDFPTWTLSLTVGYPIGTSSAEANLARARLQYSQAQVQIRNLELQVATQVRDVGRQVNTNLKRVETTRASRQLAERRLDAEEKKFAAGMSTSFFVFQAQRDLAQARNNELRATLDYSKSLVDFETVQEAAVGGGGGISLTTAGAGAPSTASGVVTTSNLSPQR